MTDYVQPEKTAGECCESCRYYSGPTNAAYAQATTYMIPKGTCLRYAPQPSQARTYPEEWCGDWTARTALPNPLTEHKV